MYITPISMHRAKIGNLSFAHVELDSRINVSIKYESQNYC